MINLSPLRVSNRFTLAALFALAGSLPLFAADSNRPNVLLIMCDDLNDYVETFGGHPQVQTPNLNRLVKSGVSFRQAHTNIPICGSSRASLFTGIYPHNSGCYGFTKWDGYGVLKNSRTMMDHFRANGYRTLGTGKLMHHLVRDEWVEYGNAADYGPFPWDGTKQIAHPDVPAPFSEIGAVDGSFGPLINLDDKRSPEGKPLKWVTGPWGDRRDLRVDSPEDRDQTADEVNGDWAIENLRHMATTVKNGDPFFMGIGFMRPHTPLIVPQRFFDLFPLESIELPVIRPGDIDDTHARSVRTLLNGWEPNLNRSEDMGRRLFENLGVSYDSDEEGLRRFIQAYLASVASVDEQIGRILDELDRSGLAENTVVVFTSDHGEMMGSHMLLQKTVMFQEAIRVPLLIRLPGEETGARIFGPVSQIDLVPTVLDLLGCKAAGECLPGKSLAKVCETALSAGETSAEGHASLPVIEWHASRVKPVNIQACKVDARTIVTSKRERYTWYADGQEEFYNLESDPGELHNLAGDPAALTRIGELRRDIASWQQETADILPPLA